MLNGVSGTTSAGDGAAFLSQLLFYSASISASKCAPSTGDLYALRVNPSSGNLHPTEFHFLTRGLNEWPDGLYHYRPSSHMAEQRALGDLNFNLADSDSSAPVVFALTSIAWRESWKYRDRAVVRKNSISWPNQLDNCATISRCEASFGSYQE